MLRQLMKKLDETEVKLTTDAKTQKSKQKNC